MLPLLCEERENCAVLSQKWFPGPYLKRMMHPHLDLKAVTAAKIEKQHPYIVYKPKKRESLRHIKGNFLCKENTEEEHQ